MTDIERKKLCFVVGPIGDEGSPERIHADWLLDGIIAPVLKDYDQFKVKRADRDPRPGNIDSHMINDLLDADLVIADLSFSNPNAFYEIGIRHMAQKPIIHMQLEKEPMPFDVSLFRTIRFSRLRFADVEKAKEDLRSALEQVLDPHYQVENPVTKARGRVNLEKNATPEMKVLLEEIQVINARLAKIERASTPVGSFNLTGNESRSPNSFVYVTSDGVSHNFIPSNAPVDENAGTWIGNIKKF
jgi:hypothetical protein